MATLQVNAVGSYWCAEYPDSNFSGSSPWYSGEDFSAYSNYWRMGFGFARPLDLSKVKINSIVFNAGNLHFEHLYREAYQHYRYSYNHTSYSLIDSHIRYASSSNPSVYTTDTLPSDYSDTVGKASPFTAYSGDRYSAITWNNQNSYTAKETLTTSTINSGSALSKEQIDFYVKSWNNGYVVGTPDYAGYFASFSQVDTPDPLDTSYRFYRQTARTYHEIYWVSNSNPYIIIDYDDIVISAKPSYPVNVNVKQGNKTVFTWILSGSDTSSAGTTVSQESYTLAITGPDGTETTYSDTTANQYREFDSNFFSVGTYSYTLSVVTNTGETVDAGSATFNVIGGTDAPDITDVTNTSIPTITWTASYQDAVEIRVSQGGTILYESGLLPGSERTTFRVPKMFDDGEYTAELRVLNIYGYYTSYCSYPFTLNPTKPTAPSNVLITTNLDYGVDIKGDTVADTTTYVVRRERGETSAEIIGVYKSGTFTDYYVAGNKAYEYALRSYSEGFTDSDYVSISVPLQGVVLRDCRDNENLIHIYQNSELFDVDRSDSISSTLISCLGRPYPIKERGEWITTTRSVSGYVSDEDYTKLTEMVLNAEKVYFQGTDEFMVCDMGISYTGRYASGGVFVKVSLTRIEDNLEVEI